MAELFCDEPIIAGYNGCREYNDFHGDNAWFDVYHDIAYHVTEGYRIVLETEADNTSSLALYVKLGFVKEQYLRKYYMNGSDAYQLTLAINKDGVTKNLSLVIDEDN